MNPKKVNWMFFSTLLFEVFVIILVVLISRYVSIGIIQSLAINQIILLVPVIAFLLITKTRITELIPFKRMKISSMLMCVVFTFLCMPAIIATNAFSMIFVENAVSELNGALVGLPFFQIIIMVGVVAPICEEFCFRGVIYHGYRKSGRVIASILLSSFLFGLTHLNFNQMSYAILVGIFCAVLVECTGTIFSAILFHMTVNCSSTILSFADEEAMMMTAEQTRAEIEAATNMGYKEAMVLMGVVYSLIAIVTVSIGICVLFLIAKNEKRLEHIKAAWTIRKWNKEKKLWSAPLVIAVVMCLVFMTYSALIPLMT